MIGFVAGVNRQVGRLPIEQVGRLPIKRAISGASTGVNGINGAKNNDPKKTNGKSLNTNTPNDERTHKQQFNKEIRAHNQENPNDKRAQITWGVFPSRY